MAYIGFNKPYMSGNELSYIEQALKNMKISGDGLFTKRCHAFFTERYKFHSVLLTTSCTDALEMSAILANIQPGDEVIVPSYTFVSTVNAFILRGAKIVFTDSSENSPNMDVSTVKDLINSKTKAIVPVHYAGIAVDMDPIMDLAGEFNLQVIEDAAQAIDSYYKGKPLGSFGSTAAFSFHETKNIISGEGGMLVINDEALKGRAEIIREKGTNRSAFFRGEVDKYNWVDIGSSFLPSDMIAAFLFAQLESLDKIQSRRKEIWNLYHKGLRKLEEIGKLKLPYIPAFATNNAHMFYVVCKNLEERTALIAHLKSNQIQAVFHYLSLHKSQFYKDKHDGRELIWSDHYSDCLLRLPFYYELSNESVERICSVIHDFYEKR
jgi:dTDP-4-amino-4,6-dideoxygalactose transaminase